MIELPTITEADVMAVRALVDGVANETQQKRALEWIIREACGTLKPTIYPKGEDPAAHALHADGQRHAGNLIRAMISDPRTLAAARAGKANQKRQQT
jgi:hypothetical protein